MGNDRRNGRAIGEALADPGTSLEELVAHREHAAAVLAVQNELKAALARLEGELVRRGGWTA